MQHGGGYGIDAPDKGILVEQTERCCSDIYYSYGWRDTGVRILPEKSIKRVKKSIKHAFYRGGAKRENIYYIMTLKHKSCP